jgi:hypothetical protein
LQPAVEHFIIVSLDGFRGACKWTKDIDSENLQDTLNDARNYMNGHKISWNKSENESNSSCNTVVLFKASASDLSKLSTRFCLIVLRSNRSCTTGQNEPAGTMHAYLTVTVDIAGLFTAFVLIGQTSTIHVLLSLSFYLVSARKKLSQKTLMRIETV